jgi:hypothetical protein
MGNGDRVGEVEPKPGKKEKAQEGSLVDMADPALARKPVAGAGDHYRHSGAPEDDPTRTKVRDLYGMHGSPETITLSEEAERKIKEKLTTYNKTLTDGNFTFSFQKDEGPWNSIDRMQQAAQAKQKAGKELTAEDRAVLSIKPEDLVQESRRIRDRDFAAFKETENRNPPRTWYKVNEKTSRYTDKETSQMMVAKEKELRTAAEKAAKEEIARQQEAARKEKERLAQEELARQQEAARKEKERLAQEELARQQEAATAGIEKQVPNEQIIKGALTQSEVVGATGLVTDAAAVRTGMKGWIAQEIQQQHLKPEILQNKYPPVGAAFVATGAVTAQEMRAALTEQERLRAAAGADEAARAQVPKVGRILEDTFKNDPGKLAKIRKASGFYDAMKRLTDEAAARETRSQVQ